VMAVTAAKFAASSLRRRRWVDFLPFWPSLAGLSEATTGGPAIVVVCQNVTSNVRVDAGAFGFLILTYPLDGPGFFFRRVGIASRIFQLIAHMRAPFLQIVVYRPV
jgi:hypothetical protein